MEKLTYRQAFDKITEAYIRGEIKPNDSHFCFCGTLCDNSTDWHLWTGGNEHNNFGNYTGREYAMMEKALFNNNTDRYGNFVWPCVRGYEDKLFAGMSAALSVLQEIHRARGEDVDEVPTFTKRELLTPAH